MAAKTTPENWWAAASGRRRESWSVPTASSFLTPASCARPTISASSPGVESRCVWLSITGWWNPSSDPGEQRRELADLRVGLPRAEGGVGDRGPLVTERGEELLRARGQVRVQQDRHRAQALGERAQHGRELGRVGLRELPRLALLDVAVEPPHPLPDALERLRDLGAVEQLADLAGQLLEVRGQL